MLISPEEINKILNLAETRKINSGKKMFEQSRVKIIDVNIASDSNYSISAVVYDSKNNNQFVCITKKGSNIDFKCDCKEYSANYATCSHVIAVLFDIYVNKEKYEKFVKEDMSIGVITSSGYKRLPATINKNSIYSSLCDILSTSNIETLYDFIKDIIKKRAYKTYLLAAEKLLNDSKIKCFESQYKNPTITFELLKDKEEVAIASNILQYEFCISKGKLMYVENDKLYTCTDEFTLNVLPYIIFLKDIKTNKIKLENDIFEKLYKKIFQNIFTYGKVLDNDKILKNYEKSKFNTSIYLDIDDRKNIILTLLFKYGKNEINPLSKLEVEGLFRNEFLELTTVKYLSDLKFKIDSKKELFYIDSDDDKFEFLKNGIKDLMSKYEVFATEKFKKRQIVTSSRSSVGVTINNNLIELDINSLNYSQSELAEIFKAYKLNKKYYKLKNDDYLNLEDDNIKALSGILNDIGVSYSDIKSGKVTMPKYKAMYLDKVLSQNNDIDFKSSFDFKDIIKKITNYKKHDYALPFNLNANLRNYQIDGYKWLKSLQEFGFGGILADDMGLGKTLQLIAILLDAKSNNCSTSLVVCPTSLCFNWQKEIEKFAPSIKSLVVCGNQKNRESILKTIEKYDVIITSYDLVKRDIEKYIDYEFNYIIADEAQYIKNTNTQNSKAMKKINAKNRVALTGTPMENSLSELWAIFDFIMPGYLYSYSKFKEVYEKKIAIENDEYAYDKLNKQVKPFILRRKKEEVLNDLPSKTETLVYSDMSDEQKELYNVFLDDIKRKILEYKQSKETSQAKIEILSLITRLRQICIHPKMFINNYIGTSSKLEQMIEILKEAIVSNHKIIIFSGFTSMLEIIEKRLEEEKISYLKLTGKTKTQERLELVEEFNKKDNINVFLVSLKAGGTGLNLIGADMVMHLDPWWNSAKEEQATDRTYRIGQKKNVQVFKFITNDSIEEKILKMQDRKSTLIDKIIKSDKDVEFKFDFEEIIEILGL